MQVPQGAGGAAPETEPRFSACPPRSRPRAGDADARARRRRRREAGDGYLEAVSVETRVHIQETRTRSTNRLICLFSLHPDS